MKNIAVITGASSGIGKKFITSLNDYARFDEVWVIARTLSKLEKLQDEVDFEIRPISLDLTKQQDYDKYQNLLEEQKPNIQLLINASGYGAFASTQDVGMKTNLDMIDLNVKGVVAMTMLSIPYMQKGARIVQIASLASYQPVPYMNVYAASKVFVKYFSRALNQELKKDGIHCMAACPYWTKTNFFNTAQSSGKQGIVKKYIVMYQPENIVKQTFKDLKKNKDVSIYGFVAKAQAF